MKHNDIKYQLFSKIGLTHEEITRLAFELEFNKRKSGKIKAPDFLLHFCIQSLEGTVSYNDLAAKVENQTEINASRQAYHQRMNKNCVAFFEAILATVMSAKYPSENIEKLIGLGKFKRILVQDSTVIRLPLRLFEIFSGVKNAHSAVCNARIQGIYDLLSRRFIKFSIDSYSKNDLSVTLDISVEKEDLVLRDRGYFTVQAMDVLKNKGADSIFRYKHKTTLFDIKTNKEINLLDYLNHNGSIDKIVLAGAKEKYKVRILAIPVNEEAANLRKMKAKKDKNRPPTKELLKLMSWTIFVTTIFDPKFTFEVILDLYGLRWRIENIFRTWKSNFSFNRIHNVSANQLRVLITARLIMITFINQHLFNPLSQKVKKTSCAKNLSMMKFMRYISKNLDVIYKISDIQNISKNKIQVLIRYCTYDIRKRLSFETKIEQVVSEMI